MTWAKKQYIGSTHPITKDEEIKIVELYKAGEFKNHIARKLHRSQDAVQRRIKLLEDKGML